jgi:hypothetical protein
MPVSRVWQKKVQTVFKFETESLNLVFFTLFIYLYTVWLHSKDRFFVGIPGPLSVFFVFCRPSE